MPARLKVKLLSRAQPSYWARYFEDPGQPVRGNCEFTFDADATDYDWLVVYEQFPRGGRFGSSEQLQCASENTLLLTTEPPTIKRYSHVFTKQFGHVLTSHPESTLAHRNRIYSQPALKWFYGTNQESGLSIAQLKREQPSKTEQISTVCSNKQQGHTLHRRRYEFVQHLRGVVPELDVFGRGVRPVNDKAEALRPYRYHLAIENYLGQHHWTEKLSDSFLGHCLPLYCGCPNTSDYFPEEAVVPIDIENREAATETIRQAIQDDWYSQRLPAIQEARRRVVEDYGLFSVLSRIISERHQTGSAKRSRLYSRYTIRLRNPLRALPAAMGTELRTLVGRFLPK